MRAKTNEQVARLVSTLGEGASPDQTRKPDLSVATLAAPVAPKALRTTLSALPRLSLDIGAEGVDLEPIRLLGEGGMGRVELVHQRSLRREVAVKQLKSDQPAAVDALLREAFLTGAVEHPNVIPIHGLGRDDRDLPVLVMKRVEGTPWRTLIQSPSHPALRAAGDPVARHVEILMQVCDAVHFAHTRGVLHRDLKPDNVMIGDFGEVYVLDWGVALRLDERGAQSGFAGTPAYLAPEMLQGTEALSERTDVYLLGACLHEALTGAPPHQGETLQGVLYAAALSEPFPYPSSVPEELAGICHRAMHVDPAQRYESALALRKALSDCLRHRGALRLYSTAEAKRRELEATLQGPGAPEQARRLFAECRFGFLQALSEWPGAEMAQEGLRRSQEAMLSFELDQKNLGAAEQLAAELEHVPEAISRRLQELRRARQEEAAAQATLAALTHERDLNVSGRARALFAAVLVGVNVTLSLALSLLRRGGYWKMSGGDAFVISVGVFGLLLGLIALGRKELLKTEVNRQLAAGLSMVALAMTLNRGLGWISGRPLEQTFSNDLILIALGAGMASVFVVPWARYAALLMLGFAGASTYRPDLAPELVSIALALPFVGMVLIWGRPARPPAR